MCQFEKPPTFTGKRENKNLKLHEKKLINQNKVIFFYKIYKVHYL